MTAQWSNGFTSTILLRWLRRETLARMLRRLETAGVVARAEPSSDALLGFELVESGTCWRPTPKNSGVLLWLFESWPVANVVARVLKSTTPSDMPFGSRRELFSVVPERIPICDSLWRTCGWASVRREFRIAWALLPTGLPDV